MRILIAIMFGLSLGWFAGPVVGEWFMDKIAGMIDHEEPGWLVRTDIGNYEDRWFLRSFVARVGLGALVPEEALYYRLVGDERGQPLSGALLEYGSLSFERSYFLLIRGDRLPPADAFWSLSAYETPSLTLVNNPAGVYQVGDRTEGLACAPNGDLLIELRPVSQLGPEVPANVLPVPDGPFDVTLRLYEPRPRSSSRVWRPPYVRLLFADQQHPATRLANSNARINAEHFEEALAARLELCEDVWQNMPAGTQKQ